MANFLSPILQPLGLDPSQGFDTAAAGARQAQGQANALSDLQWNRQMQGLGMAQGYVGNLQALYNSIYSPGGGQQAPGGAAVPMPSQGAPGAPGAMSQLTPQAPPNPNLYNAGRAGPKPGDPTSLPQGNWRGR